MTTVSGSTSTTSGVTSTSSTTGASSTGATTTASSAAAASINFNDFLQMMIAEMKNQDPTNPSDPTQYLTQMAQFSNVQQGILTNTTLNSMLTTNSLDQAENLIADGGFGGRIHVRHGQIGGALVERQPDRDADERRNPDARQHRDGRRRHDARDRRLVLSGTAPVNEADALGLLQSTIWTIMLASGPAIVTAMVVGIAVALFQALTQIQEMTLTFVPKIVAMLLVLTLTASFIGSQMFLFTEQVYARIEKGR